MSLTAFIQQVEKDGFAILPQVFADAEVAEVTESLTRALLQPCEATSIRGRAGSVCAARNLLSLWAPVVGLWRKFPLPELLHALLGPEFGQVRALFFDKPPEQTWALPWHKDVTIAVSEHHEPTSNFCKPTCKAGVPHVEAPQFLLEAMLTLRIHLDDVTEQNGPMRVIPGSHRTGKSLAIDETLARSVLLARGDVLAIRPLVAHNSAASRPGNTDHRRVLHLEFAGCPLLPDNYEWHNFIREH